MNYITTSKGERISRAAFDFRIRKAKKAAIDIHLTIYGYLFCVDCQRNTNDTIIDCSHEISVNECIKNSIPDLAYNVHNIKMRCRACHRKHDKSELQFKNID
jgi:hypothetical protein